MGAKRSTSSYTHIFSRMQCYNEFMILNTRMCCTHTCKIMLLLKNIISFAREYLCLCLSSHKSAYTLVPHTTMYCALCANGWARLYSFLLDKLYAFMCVVVPDLLFIVLYGQISKYVTTLVFAYFVYIVICRLFRFELLFFLFRVFVCVNRFFANAFDRVAMCGMWFLYFFSISRPFGVRIANIVSICAEFFRESTVRFFSLAHCLRPSS